jgi:hypothetical protein
MMIRPAAAAWCAGLAALVGAGLAGAQQNIPRESQILVAPPVVSAPTPKPGVMQQQVPPDRVPAQPAENLCALAIGAAELDALREVILGLLAKSPSRRDEFLKAEADVPADCARQKAIFYMRSLVVARNRG